MGHSKTDSWGGHRMLSFVRECKSITDNRSLSLLLRLSLALVVASTFAEAMEVKRAGFVGMRGKKQSDYASNYASYLRRPTLYDAMARNIRAGFVGMRG